MITPFDPHSAKFIQILTDHISCRNVLDSHVVRIPARHHHGVLRAKAEEECVQCVQCSELSGQCSVVSEKRSVVRCEREGVLR